MTATIFDTYYYKAFDLNNLPIPDVPQTTSTTNIITIQTLLTRVIYDASNKEIGLAKLVCYLVYNINTYSYVYAVEINLKIDAYKLNYSYYLDSQISNNTELTTNLNKSSSITPFKYNLSINNIDITNIKSSVYKYYYDSSIDYLIEAFYITF